MTRAAAMTAVSALCLLWTAGCASTGATTTQAASQAASAPAKPADDAMRADAMPDPRADVATLAKTLPGTLDGEIRRAQLLRAKGDYDEAARSLAQLILVAPDDGRVVGEYGKVLEQEGHSREALPFLKRAAQLSPNEWSVQSALGVAYDQVDDHASARAAYERALALRPGDASVLNNFAVSRMLAGDYAGAKRLFAQAQANGADNPKIAGNLEKLATLSPQPAPQPAPPPAVPQPTVVPHAQPAVSPVPGKSGVTVAAAPMSQRATAPAAMKDNHAAAPARVAIGSPKALGGQVVMQRVPYDPLAGPVHPSTPKLASNVKKLQPPAKNPPTPAKKAQPETPSLRTAADNN